MLSGLFTTSQLCMHKIYTCRLVQQQQQQQQLQQLEEAAAGTKVGPEITFCVEGNISAGKSTFLGYITNNNPDLQQELGVSSRCLIGSSCPGPLVAALPTCPVSGLLQGMWTTCLQYPPDTSSSSLPWFVWHSQHSSQ